MPNAIRGTAGKYWEIIAADVTQRGWTWGFVSLLDSKGRKLFNVDAHRDDGKRYVVSSDALLTGFLELQTQLRQHPRRSRLRSGTHEALPLAKRATEPEFTSLLPA